MVMLQIVQHVPHRTTHLLKLQSERSGNQFSGIVLPLDDPSTGGRLQLRVTVSNPALFQSLVSQTETEDTTFTVHDNDGKTLSITASHKMNSLVFQVAGGQTLVVALGTDDDVETQASVAAVAFVAVAAILVLGAVAVVAMDGTFRGGAKNDEAGSSVEVEASGNGK